MSLFHSEKRFLSQFLIKFIAETNDPFLVQPVLSQNMHCNSRKVNFFHLPFRVFRRCSAAGRTLAIYHRDNSYHRVFLANQAEIQRVKIFGGADRGHAIPFRDHNLFPPRSHLPFPRSRNAHSPYHSVCVCVCGIRHYLPSFSLPPVFFFPPSFFFTSFIESRGNSNEWKVLKRAGSGISSLCCCAILHLSIMAMRCRFHHSVG